MMCNRAISICGNIQFNNTVADNRENAAEIKFKFKLEVNQLD